MSLCVLSEETTEGFLPMRTFVLVLILATVAACGRPQPPRPQQPEPAPQEAPGAPSQEAPKPPKVPAKPEPLPPLSASLRVPFFGVGISLDTPVVIKFGAPVVRETAEQSLLITPPVPGTLSWEDDVTLIFRPAALLTRESDFTVSFTAPPHPREPERFAGFSGGPWSFRTGSFTTPAPAVHRERLEGSPFAEATAYIARAPEQIAEVEALATGGGFIFVLDSYHPGGRVAVLDPDGSFLRRQATLADLQVGDEPRAIAAGPDGALYMAAEGVNGFSLYWFKPDGSLRERKPLKGAIITSLAVDGDRLILAERVQGKGFVRTLRTSDLEPVFSFEVPAYENGPHGVAGGHDGSIYLLSDGRFYHLSAQGERLWAIEDAPAEGMDPYGFDRLHVSHLSKVGPVYPRALIPSEYGVWVLDTGWAKEIIPGQGFARKEKTASLPFISGASAPGGGLLLAGQQRIERVVGTKREPLTAALVGGPTAFVHPSFAAATADGFLLFDWEGARRYSPDGKLLSTRYSTIGAAAFGPEGAIWVHDFGKREIRLVEGDARVSLPKSYQHIIPTSDGFLTVAERRLALLDAQGQHLREWSIPTDVPWGNGFDPLPALLPDGRIALLDGPRVHLFDRQRGLVATWGEEAGFRAEWRGRSAAGPGGIAVMPDGNLLIADTLNSALKAFTPEGKHLWTYTGRTGAGALDQPRWLVADPAGFLWVGDVSRVVRLTWR